MRPLLIQIYTPYYKIYSYSYSIIHYKINKKEGISIDIPSKHIFILERKASTTKLVTNFNYFTKITK